MPPPLNELFYRSRGTVIYPAANATEAQAQWDSLVAIGESKQISRTLEQASVSASDYSDAAGLVLKKSMVADVVGQNDALGTLDHIVLDVDYIMDFHPSVKSKHQKIWDDFVADLALFASPNGQLVTDFEMHVCNHDRDTITDCDPFKRLAGNTILLNEAVP